MESLDVTRNEGALKQYKVICNKVKRETVKLIKQEQQRVALACKRNP